MQTVPGAALTERPTPSENIGRGRTSAAKVVAFAAVTLAGVLVFASHGGGGSEIPVRAAATHESDPPSGPTATSATTATTPARSASTATTHCALTPPVADDLDGDGCGDPVHVEDGRIIVVGSRRFEAGEPGDRVAVGDWDCNGMASIAVLRPSSGAVFVFERWATAVGDVTVPPITTVPGAVEVETRDRGDGCSALIALLPDGTEKEIA